MHRDPAYFMNLPYERILLHREKEFGWIARIREFNGCQVEAAYPSLALEKLNSAMLGWIQARLDAGLPVPLPHQMSTNPSGGNISEGVPFVIAEDNMVYGYYGLEDCDTAKV